MNELGLNTAHKSSDGSDGWHLLPMMSKSNDLRSNDLGSKLEDALVRVRNLESNSDAAGQSHGVVFLGMDAPILPLDDIVSGLNRAASKESTPSATLCPARDGGYAMLCVPSRADPAQTFRNLYWSHPWTGMSQTKALTDQGIFVGIGTVVRDIDEASDVTELCRHLGIHGKAHGELAVTKKDEKEATKNLELPGGWSMGFDADGRTETNSRRKAATSSHPTCHFTRSALICAFNSTRNES